MYLKLKVKTAKLISETVRRNTLVKMSTINEISILREFKSPRFINKNFCPLLLRVNIILNDVNSTKLKHAPIFKECLYTDKIIIK